MKKIKEKLKTKSKHSDNSENITFLKSENFKIYIFCQKKCYYLCQMTRLVLYQSSPVHPVLESRGGTLSVMEEENEENP